MADVCIRVSFAPEHVRSAILVGDAVEDCIGSTFVESPTSIEHIPYIVSSGISLRLDNVRVISSQQSGTCPATRCTLRYRAIRNDALCIALRARPDTVAAAPMTVPIYHNFVEAVRARSPTCIELTIGPDVISDKFTLSVLAQVGATTGDKIIVPIARDTARTTRILSPPPTAELASMWDTLALRLAILDPASLLIPGQGSIGTCPVIMKDGTCDELEYLYCSRLSH